MKAKRLSLMFVLLPAVSAMATLPENEELFYTIPQLQQQNGWLGSENAASLITYEGETFTNVSLGAKSENGGLRNVYDPSGEYEAVLDAQSYYRLNKVMLYGQLQFDYDFKKNQCWTSMAYPGSSPLLIGDKTPGNQVRETYYINGGIGVPLGAGFIAGAYMDFKGVSNAKKKDIRNKNDYSCFQIKPSLMWEKGNFRVGANYTFGSETEKIEWMIAGDKTQHEVFFFEGLWFGTSEMTSSSITNRRIERYLQEGAIQLEYAAGEAQLFNQFRFNKGEEKVYVEVEEERGGENERASYVYEGQLWLPSNQFTHSLKWTGGHSFVKSYHNLQQQYHFVQYGTVLRYVESDWNAGLNYELARIRNNNTYNRSWALMLGGDFSYHDQQFHAYPSVFTQQVRQMKGFVGFEKNFLFSKGMLDLGVNLFGKAGWGNPVDVANSGQTTNGYQYQEELQKAEFNYLTAEVAGGDFSARYTWSEDSLKGFMPYVQTSCSYQEAVRGAFKNKSRTQFELTLGLKF